MHRGYNYILEQNQTILIEAAMIYICDANLAAAVCEAGGMGMLGMNCAVDQPEYDPVQNGENLRNEIKKLRALTDKPFMVNYIAPVKGTDPKLNFSLPYKTVILEEDVPAVLIIGNMTDGNIQDEIKEFKAAGVTVVYREISCTVDACIKAAEAGADAIVVTGAEAGGHCSEYNMSLMSILPQVTDVITDIPVIAAGGIIDAKGARAAVAMGAEGVYVGTAFCVATEGRMHPNYVQAIIDAQGEDVVMWRAGTARMSTTNNTNGNTGLALANGGADRRILHQFYAGTFDASMLEGDVDRGCVSVSQAVGGIKAVRTAKEIVEDIAQGF
jgi:enoyl-[acyl-carrier protein] reductase II